MRKRHGEPPVHRSMGHYRVTFHRVLTLFCLAFFGFISVVSADCECGYAIGDPGTGNYNVFTDVLESDFTKLLDIMENTDWVPQEWKVEKAESRGPYGRQTLLKNVISNPLKDKDNRATSIGRNGNETGLELWVRKLESPDQDYISVAEVDTFRTDILHGTFRAGIQITPVNGTCGAFFWYLNDTQEIDMEFLSGRMNATYSPINLVLHSTLSFQNGGDASNTPSYKVINLPFQPSDSIHEYRFDWTPDSVKFYADGGLLIEMDDPRYIPSVPGKIVLSHWSNGQELWSGGPPLEDAKMLVQYVKGYFNTTAPDRIQDHQKRCPDPKAANAVCTIPDLQNKPVFGETYFFSQDPSRNKTNGQFIYGISPAMSYKPSLVFGYILTMTTTLLILHL